LPFVTVTPFAAFGASICRKHCLWLCCKALIVRVYTMKSYQKLSKIFKTRGLSHYAKPELAPLAALIGHIGD
ncbi:hypothetical protein, partial [Aeromonas hydrophila]|uniref:hypothetical protein n=1 Tax=Aeromonas hydrophila TaxID=644 RepID=UPI0036DD7A9D